jgi:hypothetical protein
MEKTRNAVPSFALLTGLRGTALLARITAVHDLAQIGDSHITRELLKLGASTG